MKKPKSDLNVLVLHGPNLNLLGSREPEIYGRTTLADIDRMLRDRGQELGIGVSSLQSNHEGELIDAVQAAPGSYQGMVINPAAYGHTSLALKDALAAVALPFIEVHISNVHARERFRHHSYLSSIAVGVISGLGPKSYIYALEALVDDLRQSSGARNRRQR